MKLRSGFTPSGAGAILVNQGAPGLITAPWPVILAIGGVGYDARLIRLLTAADVVDVSDRAARVLGTLAQLPAGLVGGRLDVNLGAWLGAVTPTVGQKTQTASIPVVVASNQSPISVNVLTQAGTVVYSFGMVDVPGVAAANRFLSILNPAANPSNMDLLAVLIETYSVIAAATRNSLRLTRITAASGGTLQGAASINKFNTANPNHLAEVRTANPTVTLAAEVTAFAPNQSITAAGTTAVARREFDPNPGRSRDNFVLPPGQGIALHQTIAGDVDQTYNITVIWRE